MDMVFFDSIEKLARITMTSVMVYVLVVLITKVSGKRSTSQLNNFDWIVTVMIGSLGASIILLENVPFIEGASSIIVLYALQFLVTKYASISPSFSSFILSEPRIVFYQGQFLPEAMQAERLTHQELENAMRAEGIHSLTEVEAIVFESDAKLTVLKRDNSVPADVVPETLLPIIQD